MEAIFSSKLYRTSKHKDKIHSAINDPLNVELVQQLKEYLDEPEKVEVSDKFDNQSTTSSKEKNEVSNESSKDNSSNTSSRTSSSPIIHAEPPTDSKSEESETSESESKTDSSKSESEPEKKIEKKTETEDKVEKKTETEDKDRFRTFHVPKQAEPEESSTESKVEESVTVESATVLYQQPIEAGHCCHGEFVDPDAIKGTLNVRDDTNGVSRIFIKDDELWIYYQDKINLNSVMEPVIEVLNGTGFTNLEFNRLARTENAIVFQISCVFNQIEPMKSDNE